MRLGLATIAVTLAAALLSAAPASAAPSGSAKSFSVTPTTDHERYDDGRPADVLRWNPCVPIAYKINPGALGPAGVLETKRAITMAARATGLRFHYAGTTTWVPRSDRDGRTVEMPPSVGVPLVVGYSTARQTNFFGSGVGTAAGTAQLWTGYSDEQREQIRSAAAFTRTDLGLPGGFGSGGSRGAVVLHELAHALGLGHVADRSQIMFPTMLRGITAEYQRGDLTGLKRVGRAAGCILTVVPPKAPLADPEPDATAGSPSRKIA